MHHDRIHDHPLCQLISIMSVAAANAKQEHVAARKLGCRNEIRVVLRTNKVHRD